MFFSIVIPTYEMKENGCVFLKHNLDILEKQTFIDFQVIISDHSKNDNIKDLINEYNKLNIRYFRNKNNIGSSSANVNNGINKSSGKYIKIIFQDDFLYNENSLLDLNKFIIENNEPEWIVTASEHTEDGIKFIRPFQPKWNNKNHLGINTISSPSVLCFKNKEDNLLFDENLIWFMDTDYYQKLYNKYGLPKILNNINVVNRIGSHQVSNSIITDEIIKKETEYLKKQI